MFEEIKYNSRTSKPLVVFSLSNTIRFPKSLLKKYNLENKQAVRVYVDNNEIKCRIGFLFLDEYDKEYLKLSKVVSGAFVSGNSIFTSIGMNPKEMDEKQIKRKFEPVMENFEGKELLVIEIPKN